MQRNNYPRINALTAMHLMCSVMIMARHYAFFISDSFPYAAKAIGRIDFTDYFFCCGGFLLHYSLMGKGDGYFLGSMKRKFFRIYPLHILTVGYYAIAILLLNQTSSLQKAGNFLDCALPQILLIHSFGVLSSHCMNYPTWFLSAFLFLCAGYPLLHKVARSVGVVGTSIIVCVGLALLQTASEITGRNWSSWSYDFGFLRGIPTFVIGYMVAENVHLFGRIFRSFIGAWTIFFTSLFGMLMGFPPLFVQILLQVALVAALAGPEQTGKKGILTSVIFQKDPNLSLSIFLLHVPVASAMLSFISVRILHLSGLDILVAVITTMVVTTALASVLNYGIANLGVKSRPRA